jgi:hypothetical protein
MAGKAKKKTKRTTKKYAETDTYFLFFSISNMSTVYNTNACRRSFVKKKKRKEKKKKKPFLVIENLCKT